MVRKHDDTVGRRLVDRDDEVPDGRVVSGPSADHRRSERAERGGDAVAVGHGDQRRRLALPHTNRPRLVRQAPFDRGPQVDDRRLSHRPRPAHRLDRRVGLVGVDVDVEEAATADDDERVADPCQAVAERGEVTVLGGLDEYLDLEGLRDLPALGAPVAAATNRTARGEGFARRVAGDGGPQRVEENDDPLPARVDHAGLRELRELLGGPGQRRPCGLQRVIQDTRRVRVVRPGGSFRGGGGGGAQDREHRPLDRRADGAVGLGRRPAEHRGDPGSARGGRERACHGPQDLREDHSGIPARTHQSCVRHGSCHRGRVGSVAIPLGATFHLRHPVDHGLLGQPQVRPGVAVRHRVDVQRVDGGLVRAQRVMVGVHRPRERGRVQLAFHQNRW